MVPYLAGIILIAIQPESTGRIRVIDVPRRIVAITINHPTLRVAYVNLPEKWTEDNVKALAKAIYENRDSTKLIIIAQWESSHDRLTFRGHPAERATSFRYFYRRRDDPPSVP